MTVARPQTPPGRVGVPDAKGAVGKPLRRKTSLFAHGEPMVWLTGGTLAISLVMIAGLLGLVLWFGVATFWPSAVIRVETRDGSAYMGEVTNSEDYVPGDDVFEAMDPKIAAATRGFVAESGGSSTRRQLRTGNFELTGTHFTWLSDFQVAGEDVPEWAIVVERMKGGRFYGIPKDFRIDGEAVAFTPEAVWERFQEYHAESRERFDRRRDLETSDVGKLNYRLEKARLRLKQTGLDHGLDSEEYREEAEVYAGVQREFDEGFADLQTRIAELNAENERYELALSTADGREKVLVLADVVRSYPANQLGFFGKVKVYFSRWGEFLLDDPREANSEGGVLPAIFGTVAMTMIMSLIVVPFGVLAALYLREYARQGAIVSAVRIAVNNLAGVPSIVFGVFGLGFFIHIIGDRIDRSLYEAKLPDPTYGTPGLLWASLTLALLTLPVVIVATEEAISAVPNSMRDGSYACGATKWQTIRKIVLPRAAPGIMTGMILAIARGAGEVAPLMLVGVLKLAPKMPFDGNFPFVHAERSFMHLGFHIWDIGFQSQNSEAAKPMVYTTTLLLIVIIVLLNLLAIWIRARLRRRFAGSYV